MMWEFMNTGFHSGTFNMEFDEALAHRLGDGTGPPTLRLFGWNPYTISVGFNQPMEDFNHEAISRSGYDIVRRPTGGRAIFHAHELTYSVVMNVGERSVREIYHYISEGILEGLRLLGITAELSGKDDRLTTPFSDPSSIPCFASSARSEIHVDGKKLVGSAQRRYGKVVLQHGSFLLGPQHKRIVDFLSPHVLDALQVIEESLTYRTTDAETILGRTITFDEAARCVKEGFERACGMEFSTTSQNNEHTIVSIH
jgi:lipoate-protein ligase A